MTGMRSIQSGLTLLSSKAFKVPGREAVPASFCPGKGALMTNRNWFYLKACPRCQGDLYLDGDAYGPFRQGLQCGRVFELELSQPTVSKAGTDKIAAWFLPAECHQKQR
jgi:hypothetical protein